VEALALHDRGLYAEAVEQIFRILAENSNDAKALALLARLFANQGKLREALEWCKRAINSDKSSPALRYLLATILQEQAQCEEAVHSLKQALYLDPNFVLAHFMLGKLAGQQRKFKEAERHFATALTILRAYPKDEALLESDGTTAGRLAEIIAAISRNGVSDEKKFNSQPGKSKRGRPE
jgi:chemotaxis protein methyltransferase CheR